MEFYCCLPHVVGQLQMQNSPIRSVIFKDICDNHLRYFLGLEESSVVVNPHASIRDIVREPNPRGVRGPALFAAQNITYAAGSGSMDDVVFRKNDVVIPTSSYANSQFKLLNEKRISLAPGPSNQASEIFINSAITRYLRLLTYKKEYLQKLFGRRASAVVGQSSSGGVGGDIRCPDFKRLLSLIETDAVDQVKWDAHTTYLINLFEPLKSMVRKQAPSSIAGDLYLYSIFNARQMAHMNAESYRSTLVKQFANLFRYPENISVFSGMFWFVLKSIDVPVGPNVEGQPSLAPGGCPPEPSPDAARYPFTYRYSQSIPNLIYDANKGFVATRHIYDREELTLEPFVDDEKRYVTEASFFYMNYNSLPPEHKQGCGASGDSAFKRYPIVQAPPKLYVQDSSKIKAREDILYDGAGDSETTGNLRVC